MSTETMLQTMSLGSIVALTVIWLAMLKALTSESVFDAGRHRHTFRRRQLHRGENLKGDVRFRRDDTSLQPFLLFDDEDAEIVDDTLELDKPRECFQFVIYSIRAKLKHFNTNLYVNGVRRKV